MINYKELRVGNWVKKIARNDSVHCDEKYIQVTNVSKEGYNLQHPYSILMYDWQWFEPIELTEELIERLGFKNVGVEWQIKLEYSECFEIVQGRMYYTAGEGIIMGIGCKYLHELQNLLFSLFGVELEYKH